MSSPHCYDNGCIIDYPHNCICDADMHVPGSAPVSQAMPAQQLPPPDLLKKLARIQEDFPDGFVIFIAPQKEKLTWIGVFRWNPKRLRIIEAIYQKITGNQMTGGSSN